ncbi:MAG: elongator complex protein 3 [Clostridium sp.]
MNKPHYIIPIFVPHEGCPHTCVFCNQKSITGKKNIVTSCNKVDGNFVRDTIEEYLKTINKDNSIIEVSFFGGTFTAIAIEKQRELLAVAKEYKDLGKIDYIRMSTRPDYIDDFILTNLKKYNADIIELGVQSLDEEVLLKSGRGHDKESVKRASKLIKEYGMTVGHQIMLGLPGDTFEKDIETARKSIDMKPDICRLYPALVIKDTPMEELLQRNEYKPYTLEQAVEISKILYAMYMANGINVIRIGLQPTEEINYGKEFLQGPFHPSFRELVEGSIYKDIILYYSNEKGKIESMTINPKDISKLYANKKKYFYEALDNLGIKKIKVYQDNDIDRGNIRLTFKDDVMDVCINEYLRKY